MATQFQRSGRKDSPLVRKISVVLRIHGLPEARDVNRSYRWHLRVPSHEVIVAQNSSQINCPHQDESKQ